MSFRRARSSTVALILLAATAAAAASGREAAVALPIRVIAPGELQAALAEAAPGQTLELLTGIHRGPVTIRSSVRLQGRPGAILEGDGHGTVLTLAADGIEVEGLEIRGGGADLSTDDAIVLLHDASGIVVRGCTVRARAFGIYLRGGGHHRILDNEVVGDAGLAASRRGNGIHLWHTTDNEVSDNHVADVRDGVYLSFAHDNLIRRNVGTGLRYGIHYMYSERNRLDGNRFSASTGGIALMFSMGNQITSNVLQGNRDFGILCQQLERSTFAGNEVRANGRGLYLENSAGNRFEGNRIERNGVGAYLTAGSEDNRLTANRFVANLVQVYQDRPAPNRWFEHGRGNFWSDYVGFDWDGDGVGETPYRLETATSALMARRPAARWLWRSPLVTLLDWWELRLPVARRGGFDSYPLVAPPLAVAQATMGAVPVTR